LRSANSGHPGSLSTVHADSPEGAFTQLVFMMQQAGSTSTEENLRSYIKSIINIVIQLKKDSSSNRFNQSATANLLLTNNYPATAPWIDGGMPNSNRSDAWF